MTLPRELLARVDAISEDEDRPRSATVRRLLRRALAERDRGNESASVRKQR